MTRIHICSSIHYQYRKDESNKLEKNLLHGFFIVNSKKRSLIVVIYLRVKKFTWLLMRASSCSGTRSPPQS